jgi:hypothetical protein
MNEKELKNIKHISTILISVLMVVFVVIIYLIFTDQKIYYFFFQAKPTVLWSFIISPRYFNDLKNLDIFIIFYTLFIFFLGAWYFKKRRKYNIEHHIEEELTNMSLDENSIIKCGSTSKYGFLNCKYEGKATTEMPEWAKQRNPAYGSDLMKTSQEDWEKYKSAKHFYCPKCGKEMYDKNLIQNFRPVVQNELFKYFIFLTALSLFITVFIIEEFVRLQQNAYFSINSVFIALAGFLTSLIITLVLKK